MVGELVTPMIKRAFSRDERNFYNTLANGIDENILYVLSWLKTYEASELLDADDEDEFDDIFAASGLHDELNKRIQRNTLNGIAPLSRFYKVGSRLAYNQYRQTQRYTPQDAEALEILNQYVGDAIYNGDVKRQKFISLRFKTDDLYQWAKDYFITKQNLFKFYTSSRGIFMYNNDELFIISIIRKKGE